MKKSATRTVLFCLLIAASLSSYIYLSVLSAHPGANAPAETEEYAEDLEAKDAKIILPDIHLVKKVVETGKRLIPAS